MLRKIDPVYAFLMLLSAGLIVGEFVLTPHPRAWIVLLNCFTFGFCAHQIYKAFTK